MRRLWPLVLALALAGCGGDDLVAVTTDASPEPEIDRLVRTDGKGAAIHAIGIYGLAAHDPALSAPRREVEVRLQQKDARPIRLALSAYEPVNWIVTGPGAAHVEAIYLDGRARQKYAGVPLDARVYNRSGAPAPTAEWKEKNMGPDRDIKPTGEPEWGVDAGERTEERVECALTRTGGLEDCDHGERFIANAERLLDGRLSSFTGVKYASAFAIASLPEPGVQTEAAE